MAAGPSTASPPWWALVHSGCPAGTHGCALTPRMASGQSANPCWCVACCGREVAWCVRVSRTFVHHLRQILKFCPQQDSVVCNVSLDGCNLSSHANTLPQALFHLMTDRASTLTVPKLDQVFPLWPSTRTSVRSVHQLVPVP